MASETSCRGLNLILMAVGAPLRAAGRDEMQCDQVPGERSDKGNTVIVMMITISMGGNCIEWKGNFPHRGGELRK